MEVTPDGTVVVGSRWDEGGRCIGLYKDGSVNCLCLGKNDRKGGHRAGGWGTSTEAVAVDGEQILLASADGEFYRFAWRPGDIDSARFIDATPHPHGDVERDKATAVAVIGMHARAGRVAVLLADGRVEIRAQADWAVQAVWRCPGARDLVWGTDGSLWLALADRVEERTAAGDATGRALTEPGLRPSAVAISPDGHLVVCDDGECQQVRWYSLAGKAVTPAGSFGQPGGIRAGTPGVPTHDKLMRPAGANFDAAGNLYIGMRYDEFSPSGGFILRCIGPDGSLRWEQACHLFSEVWDVVPGADGALTAYGFRNVFTKPARAPRGAWTLSAVTLDSLRQRDDLRYRPNRDGWPGAMLQATTAWRQIDGVGYIFSWGSGGNSSLEIVRLDADGRLGRHVQAIAKPGPWAYEVDARGDVWFDEGHTVLLRQRHQGGRWGKPERFPLPAGIREVHRIAYDVERDRMYLSGYTDATPKPEGEWGLIGRALLRIDGFTTPQPRIAWTSHDLRLDDGGLPPKAMAWAGDYLFTAACKPTADLRGQIYVYRADSGAFVGRISAPREIAEQTGWIDLSHGLRARERDGVYYLAQEDNWHAKVILHIWKPEG
ncbi:MAG: hypothetical protein KJ070_19315 [Verrucomicrobia bacterium]|nr:hypothetical protein [Verrucomicrobiota bacterium]